MEAMPNTKMDLSPYEASSASGITRNQGITYAFEAFSHYINVFYAFIKTPMMFTVRLILRGHDFLLNQCHKSHDITLIVKGFFYANKFFGTAQTDVSTLTQCNSS